MAIRRGHWKLIEFLQTGEKQLFDLDKDPAEKQDQAAAKPALVSQLSNRLAAWRRETVKS